MEKKCKNGAQRERSKVLGDRPTNRTRGHFAVQDEDFCTRVSRLQCVLPVHDQNHARMEHRDIPIIALQRSDGSPVVSSD
jgi:hypothetical protein